MYIHHSNELPKSFSDYFTVHSSVPRTVLEHEKTCISAVSANLSIGVLDTRPVNFGTAFRVL